MIEKAMDINTLDGICDATLYQPDEVGAWPGILFFMDGIGIRPAMQEMAGRLAGNGYVVLQPNLYYRHGRARVMDQKRDHDTIMTMLSSLTWPNAVHDIAAYLDALSGNPATQDAPHGCFGYCLGGGFALTAAGTYPGRIAAAASIHGARLANDEPGSPHTLAPEISARVYVAVAEIDPGLEEGEMDRLEAALSAADVYYEMDVYAGAEHGFAIADFSVYDQQAAERHWERLLTLFDDTLKGVDKPAP